MMQHTFVVFIICLLVDQRQAIRHAGISFEYPYQGEDFDGHIGPEAGTWELDHLIHSATHTGVSIFVKFYIPKERQSKRLEPVWDGVIARFQSTPTVKILSLDCRGKARIACQDHNVRTVPSIQHFQPGFAHGQTYTGPVDQYHLEQWILHIVEEEHRGESILEDMDGCIGFRQTADCDPDGVREAWKDRSCMQEVPDGVSGYCECTDGEFRSMVTCTHPPFNCHDICVEGRECVAWRQTGNCRADGPREEWNDLPCRRAVPKAASGYCECSNGRRTAFVECNHPGSFTCESKCLEALAAEAAAQGGSGGEALSSMQIEI